jgi:hypothetical protein
MLQPVQIPLALIASTMSIDLATTAKKIVRIGQNLIVEAAHGLLEVETDHLKTTIEGAEETMTKADIIAGASGKISIWNSNIFVIKFFRISCRQNLFSFIFFQNFFVLYGCI